MRRTITPAVAVPTADEAMQAMKEFIAANNRTATINAKIDDRISTIRNQYADDLTGCEAKKKESFEKLEAYAKAHPELFTETRSLALGAGVIGYSLNPPAVTLINAGEKEDACIVEMQTYRKLKPYINIKYTIDKKALIKERENVEILSLINNCGLDITQKEVFFAKSL